MTASPVKVGEHGVGFVLWQISVLQACTQDGASGGEPIKPLKAWGSLCYAKSGSLQSCTVGQGAAKILSAWQRAIQLACPKECLEYRELRLCRDNRQESGNYYIIIGYILG